jgi:hypothetical protein
MSRTEILGYLATASVLATFCMNTMVPLRIAAITSNLVFAAYGWANGSYLLLAMHLILLPVNLYKLWRLQQMIARVRSATQTDLSLDALLPFLRERKMAAGQLIFRKGEQSDGLYYVGEGEVEIVEFSIVCGQGSIFGEMGVFAPGRNRTATAVCRTDSVLYFLGERNARELYFQNPEFGFSVLGLIIARVNQNMTQMARNEPVESL